MAWYSDVFVSDSNVSYGRRDENRKSETTKLNLLPNERLESFWDALWLAIRTFLCLIVEFFTAEVMLIRKVKPQN